MRLEEGSQPLATLCLRQLFCRTKVSLQRRQKSHNSWLNWNQLLLPYLLCTVLAIAIAIAIIDTFDIKWLRQKSWKMMLPKFTESCILPNNSVSLFMSFYSFVLGAETANWVLLQDTHRLNLFSMWNQISQLAELNKQTASHVLYITMYVVVFWGSSPYYATSRTCQIHLALSALIGWWPTNWRALIGREIWGRVRRGGAAFRAGWPPPPEWLRVA